MTDSPPTVATAPASAGLVAFVLGGGGVHGACEVGVIRALIEAGISPALVLVRRTRPCTLRWWFYDAATFLVTTTLS